MKVDAKIEKKKKSIEFIEKSGKTWKSCSSSYFISAILQICKIVQNKVNKKGTPKTEQKHQ